MTSATDPPPPHPQNAAFTNRTGEDFEEIKGICRISIQMCAFLGRGETTRDAKKGPEIRENLGLKCLPELLSLDLVRAEIHTCRKDLTDGMLPTWR